MKSLKNKIWDEPSIIPYAMIDDELKCKIWHGLNFVDFLYDLENQIINKCKDEVGI